MKLWNKLQSPGALVIEGFLLGALLFLTLEPLGTADEPVTPAAAESVLSTLEV